MCPNFVTNFGLFFCELSLKCYTAFHFGGGPQRRYPTCSLQTQALFLSRAHKATAPPTQSLAIRSFRISLRSTTAALPRSLGCHRDEEGHPRSQMVAYLLTFLSPLQLQYRLPYSNGLSPVSVAACWLLWLGSALLLICFLCLHRNAPSRSPFVVKMFPALVLFTMLMTMVP